MVTDISKAFNLFENSGEVKVVVIKAVGEAFCAGADLAYLKMLQSNSYDENLKDSNLLRIMFEQIYSFKKLVIAQIEGHALAGGAGLATVCDIVISVPDAKFGFTEVKIGFVPALVSYFLIRKITEAYARELLLTGKIIRAKDALSLGIVNYISHPNEIELFVNNYAQNIAESTSAESITQTKNIMEEIYGLNISTALDKLEQLNAKARQTDDCQRGIELFLNKKK